MLNPFKKTYKISESNTKGEISYFVEYGSFFNKNYLGEKGGEHEFWINAEIWGGKFNSLNQAKEVIKLHAADLIDKRLRKPITKTIQYV